MKIHEYQAKRIFADYGISVDESVLCKSVGEVLDAYDHLHTKQAVIKAQILTGGRGKAGGVKLANSRQEAAEYAGEILGMNIKGFTVDRVLVGAAVDIESEYYLSIVIDRKVKSAVVMLSRDGGMDIEAVAQTTPERIVRLSIDPLTGMTEFLARRAAFVLFDRIDLVLQATQIIQRLYQLFIKTDASLAEINPLVLTKDGRIMAIDAKMTFDKNALERHPDIHALFEPTEEEKKEEYAKEKGFSYVGLDGAVGCMVNGAGLAMATMDMIKLYGGNPANFLDIGGSSNPNKVVEAVKLLLSDAHVKVILINIFGGITRCDDVARGLIEAFKHIERSVPVVIRLTGTNEQEGREILKNTWFHVAESMKEATKKAVELSKKN